MSSVVIGTIAATYASVPLYKVFCQRTGFGGTTKRAEITFEEKQLRIKNGEEVFSRKENGFDFGKFMENPVDTVLGMIYNYTPEPPANRVGSTWKDSSADKTLNNLRPVKNGRPLTIEFTSSVHDSCPMKFTPCQNNVKIIAGETALAFYTCKNLSPHPITAVSTYNVYPPQAGRYFNKVQCFCFEEQRILGNEEVDLPVLFYIDPEFYDDAGAEGICDITLSYSFFKTGDEPEEEEEGQTRPERYHKTVVKLEEKENK